MQHNNCTFLLDGDTLLGVDVAGSCRRRLAGAIFIEGGALNSKNIEQRPEASCLLSLPLPPLLQEVRLRVVLPLLPRLLVLMK
mmetsp:Transcript_17958/g.39438  ORF Transcript_17958/g.39438 Transcript_17958/m.39438 type:complete len:83 (-) Transcript_17958:113-361(-)